MCSSGAGAPLVYLDFLRLRSRCDVTVTNGWERIRPVLPDKIQRGLLGIDAGQPAFRVERLGMDATTPVEWRHSVVRGDRFSFVATWSGDPLTTALEATGRDGDATATRQHGESGGERDE